ncbi:MAG: CPBP family intramembrane metalloprotease [Clostridiales Family XIII bacterium]|nr:CPBP family intramembrane metalloprotease [Clostridiales Family XIII bacterium]
MVLDEIIRAVMQIIALSFVPFVSWIIAARKKEKFAAWVGLKKVAVAHRGRFIVGIAVGALIAVAISFVLDSVLPKDIQPANGRFADKGFTALLPAMIFSFAATALPEEIFFRGFIGAKLSNRLGFAIGNTIQAILFGLLHGAAVFGAYEPQIPTLVIIFTGTMGWTMGYINKKADGSIIPSICLHGASNLYSSILILFALF